MGRYRICAGLSPATGSVSSSAAEPLVWPQNDSLSCARSFLSTPSKAAGIQPLSWLPLRSTVSRVLLRLPSAGGIVPVSWLLCRRNICSCERLPSVAGILPVSWLSVRSKTCSWERLPSCEGMLPDSSLSRRRKRVTFDLEMAIPSHWSMGRCILQLSDALPRRVFLRPRSVSQSVMRLVGSGLGIAAVLAHGSGVGVCVAVAVGVGVEVAVAVAVGVAVGVAVAVAVDVAVAVAVEVGVAVGIWQNCRLRSDWS